MYRAEQRIVDSSSSSTHSYPLCDFLCLAVVCVVAHTVVSVTQLDSLDWCRSSGLVLTTVFSLTESTLLLCRSSHSHSATALCLSSSTTHHSSSPSPSSSTLPPPFSIPSSLCPHSCVYSCPLYKQLSSTVLPLRLRLFVPGSSYSSGSVYS